MSGLRVEGVTVVASGRQLLSAASLAAATGEITGIIGPNGAGKSTLIAAALGLHPLAGGAVRFSGIDLPSMSPAERSRLCAHVEQSSSTSERLTVRDAVALGRIPFQSWQAGKSAADDAIVEAALAELALTPFAERLYQTLSGGEQQRVQVARALAQQPQLWLLDEPTSHLDIAAQLDVFAMLRRAARGGATVLVALHDLNLAAATCDRLVLVGNGRVAAAGTPAEVLTPELLRQVYGVTARVVTVPGRRAPVVVHDLPGDDCDRPDSD